MSRDDDSNGFPLWLIIFLFMLFRGDCDGKKEKKVTEEKAVVKQEEVVAYPLIPQTITVHEDDTVTKEINYTEMKEESEGLDYINELEEKTEPIKVKDELEKSKDDILEDVFDDNILGEY